MNSSIKIVFSSVLVAFFLTTGCSTQATAENTSEGESSKADSGSGNPSVDYFNTDSTQTPTLTQLSEKIWTYNYYFDRGLIIDTDVGLVVVDSFSPHYVSGLLAALKEAGVDKPVHTLIYTHYHLDHTSGGNGFAAKNVICHVKCASYWGDFPSDVFSSVAKVTKVIDKDFSLTVGGVSIQLVDLGSSHTDTMFAVYLPDEKTLFAADTVAVDVFLPSGGISLYYPAYLKALDTLQNIDFDLFVSSHFAWGSKQQFIAAADMQRDAYAWSAEALEKYSDKETGVPIFQDQERMTGAFYYFHTKMKAKYGDWHGFDAQIFSTFSNALTAHHIGS